MPVWRTEHQLQLDVTVAIAEELSKSQGNPDLIQRVHRLAKLPADAVIKRVDYNNTVLNIVYDALVEDSYSESAHFKSAQFDGLSLSALLRQQEEFRSRVLNERISDEWFPPPWTKADLLLAPVSPPVPKGDTDDNNDDQEHAEWTKVQQAINQLSPEEETDMSFNRKGKKLPNDVAALDVNELHMSQMRVLADALGCRRQVEQTKDRTEQNKILTESIKQQPNRAQKFYDVICMQKEPGAQPTKGDAAEERYVELLTSVLNAYSQALDDSAKKAVIEIMKGVQKNADQLKDMLTDFAKQAVRDAADKRAPITIKEGDKKRKVKGVLPPEFERMVQLASARIPILLVGPTGCGKTYLCEKLAEALDMDYSDQSCSEGMSESVFNGRLLPIGDNGRFEHVPSPFLTRYEAGGVMLLDEMDAGDPNLFTYINKAVANDAYTVEQRYKKPMVRKHDDFVLVAAANTYGHGADAMYVGRNQLDAATLDRFKVGNITMDYNREVEESLGTTEVLKWAWPLRDKIRTAKLRRTMSTRVIKDISEMTRRYSWDKVEWEKSFFTGWTEAERKLVV